MECGSSLERSEADARCWKKRGGVETRYISAEQKLPEGAMKEWDRCKEAKMMAKVGIRW